MCRDIGDLEKAKEYHQLALNIGKEQLGPYHANVAVFFNNLGAVHHKSGDLETGNEYYRRAAEIDQMTKAKLH